MDESLPARIARCLKAVDRLEATADAATSSDRSTWYQRFTAIAMLQADAPPIAAAYGVELPTHLDPNSDERPLYRKLWLGLNLLKDIDPAIAREREHCANTSARANTSKLFSEGFPDNPDLRDLAIKLDQLKGNGQSKNEIARGFFQGDESKAKSSLAELRRQKSKGNYHPD